MNSGNPSDSEIRAAHAKAVGGARPRCTRGKSCSAACITRTDRCLVAIPVSPANALSQVRDQVETEKVKQLQLIKTGEVVSEKAAQDAFNKFRKGSEREIVGALGIGDRETYETTRNKVIDYNKMLVREGLSEKTGLMNVPVDWDRAQKVKKAYHRAVSSLSDKMEDLAKIGHREEYDKVEDRLMKLQRRLGTKVGDSDFVKRGKIWDLADGDDHANNYFLKGIREDSSLKGSKITRYYDDLSISRRVGKHEVKVTLEDHGKIISFTVDGSYQRPKGLTNEEGKKIAEATDSIFRSAISHMEDGTTVRAYPYDGDGRGPKRRRAYERAGFVSFPNEGDVFGMIYGGRLERATREDLEEFYMSGGIDNFREIGKEERVKLFYTILWGESLD